MLDVTLLGCGATQPLPDRALAAMALRAGPDVLLLDCGEGTQVAMRRCHVSPVRVHSILLTHYHGDHVFGLPGLLQTMGNLGRSTPLHLYGPPGLAALWQAVHALAAPLSFAVQPHELPPEGDTFAAGALRVTAFPLCHRVPCLGYACTLPRAGKFDPARARAAGIPVHCWAALQAGQCVGPYTPDQVLGPARRGLTVVYATDTAPCERLCAAAADADLLVMDATYADDADADKAALYGHATCAQAGALAARAGVRRLWLTHYSAAMQDPAAGLTAARRHFAVTQAGYDGLTLTLGFDRD